MVDGLFDSRDMDPRVRFGGLAVADTEFLDDDAEDEEDEERFSSSLATPLDELDPCEPDAVLELADVVPPFVECDDRLPLLLFSCAELEEVVEVVPVAPLELFSVLTACPEGDSSVCSFFRLSRLLNSASGSANSL